MINSVTQYEWKIILRQAAPTCFFCLAECLDFDWGSFINPLKEWDIFEA